MFGGQADKWTNSLTSFFGRRKIGCISKPRDYVYYKICGVQAENIMYIQNC